MGPKKGKGKGKGKGKQGEGPQGPTAAELLAKIAVIDAARDKETQERNLMMLERDKVSPFWEVKKEEYDKLLAEFRNKDRAMEELEEQHQLELMLYNQRMKHLLYEQQNMMATIKADNEQALKLQLENFGEREGELVNDKRALKDKVKEMELSYEDTIRAMKLEHAKEATKMRQEFDQNAKELNQKFDRKIKELRDEMDLRRKSEIHEIEERKNLHASELMRKHEKAFTDIKCYYNDITHNNLDLIKVLKEDVTDMKKKEAANEKLMYDIAQENKRLTEPLAKSLKEVEKLRLGMQHYEKDKHLLAQASSELKEKTKQFKQLEWDYQVLQKRCEQLQSERDEVFAKFESSIYDVQQKCGLESLLLQRKVQILGEKLEKKEAQLGEAGVKVDDSSGIESILESKNNLIKSLRYDLGKITKGSAWKLGMTSSRSFRKVIGSIKDTTKVGLATLNSDYKDLDIAVVKATSHVECPPKEKHVRTIFLATSSSRPRADVAYCIHALARRIAKTHTWTVALKSMMVIHRTLREGDPTFRDELLNYARNRGHVLNLSNFKDDSSPSAWDYSAWVRTYALFLEERLECCRILKYDVEAERTANISRTRELDTEELLEQLPALQQLLHRLMGCQPEGAAITNYVIQAALSLCLKESFKLYSAINDGIINLVDKFFEMTRHNALKALEIYKRATLQAGRLVEFYEMCKGLNFARNFQFPVLEQPPKSFLFTMEDYVRDAPRTQEEYDERYSKNLASPGDKGYEGEPPLTQPMPEEFLVPPRSVAQDLMELNDGLQTERDSFNLGLYQISGAQPPQVTGWELALVSDAGRADSVSSPSNKRVISGFDKELLNSLYDDAIQRRFQTAAAQRGGSPVPSLAPINPFDDIFAASNNYAPPSPVSMAVMQKEASLLQTQQRLTRMSGFSNNPFGNSFELSPGSPESSTSSPPQLTLPPQLKNPQEACHQTNPFGNPSLL